MHALEARIIACRFRAPRQRQDAPFPEKGITTRSSCSWAKAPELRGRPPRPSLRRGERAFSHRDTASQWHPPPRRLHHQRREVPSARKPDPLPDELEACSAYLDRQVELINPRIIVTLSRFSAPLVWRRRHYSRTRADPQYRPRAWALAMFHPAAACATPSGGRTLSATCRNCRL